MKMHMILTLDDSQPGCFKAMAAIQGLAASLNVPLTQQPEEEQKSGVLRWPLSDVPIPDKYKESISVARRFLKTGKEMPKKELIERVAEVMSADNRFVGTKIASWIKRGIIEEV